jgi:CRISPR-associated protein Cas2
MLVLITYDVSTESAKGKIRLRKVAKICVNYGQRVQNSVFECSLSPAELCVVKDKLLKVIDSGVDSLRIYNLGNNYKSRIEHYGAKSTYFPDDAMII